MSTIKIASIQIAVVENNKQATIDKAVKNIHQAKDADIILLPEIWNIGFMSFDHYINEAESINGPTLSAIRKASIEIGSYIHTGSFIEKDGDKYFNSSYLISPQGKILANYRKIHLFGYQSRETNILTAGHKVIVVNTPIGKFGLCTCYDLRFPELFRQMVDQGTNIFLVSSAWPYPRLEHWIMLNRVRALENQCFLASANSAGTNQGTQFVGHSMIVDPWGIILAGSGDNETIVHTEIDLNEVEIDRKNFPALADRCVTSNWGV